jgi:predicted DsbA family dithiol-disulfide isomerase
MIVDLVHDVVCPWCRIGYANLKTAAKSFPDDPLTIRLRPFLLEPTIPDAGVDFKQYMAHIAGSDDIAPVHEKVIKAGELAGVTFQFDHIQKRPNSIFAHMAIMAAPVEDRDRFLEALHKAYFDDGRDIGERETLLAIAEEIGLNPKAIGAALSYPQWREMVSEQAKQISTDGVRGVPFFVFNDSLSLAGAYPAPQLAQAWTKAQELAAEKQQTATETPAEPQNTPVETTTEAKTESPAEPQADTTAEVPAEAQPAPVTSEP